MNLNAHQFTSFVKYKQDQYNKRRQKIREMCQKVKNKKLWKSLNHPKFQPVPNMIFDPIHELVYCQIPKV